MKHLLYYIINDNEILTIICHIVYATLAVFQCRLILYYLQLIFIFFEIYQNLAKIAGVVSVFAVSSEKLLRGICSTTQRSFCRPITEEPHRTWLATFNHLGLNVSG